MAEATISSKGQIAIPVAVREALSLKGDTRIQFQQEQDGRFSFVPVTNSILSMKGIVPRLGGTVSLEEMDEAIAQGAVERLRRRDLKRHGLEPVFRWIEEQVNMRCYEMARAEKEPTATASNPKIRLTAT